LPPSAADRRVRAQAQDGALAIWAESLYLANLLVAPGLAFAALAWLCYRHRRSASALARCHLEQTMSASIWAGILLVIANAVVIAFGGYASGATWLVVIIWFTCIHSTLVLLGMVGLSKALAGKEWIFPLVGKRSHE
jgi:hypothetical protein